jgi:hypothetical protein
MSSPHDDDGPRLTLELRDEAAATLVELYNRFGEEFVADLLCGAIARVTGDLTLRGVLPLRGQH